MSRIIVSVGAIVGGSAGALGQTCTPHWDGVGGSVLDAGVESVHVTTEAGSQVLYIGGAFQSAGGFPALRVARYDGAAWSGLGDGIPSPTHGVFGCCAKVTALAAFDSGGGPSIHLGGNFIYAGSIQVLPVESITRWQGGSWHDLSGGLGFQSTCVDCEPRVYAQQVWNDGTGTALYAAGSFELAGGVFSPNIARWNGVAWSALGGGLTEQRPGSPTPAWTQALGVFDGDLYAAGQFTHAGMQPANSIARWDGAAWSALGDGLGPNGNEPPFAYGFALAAFNDGSGPALYVGGEFSSAGGAPAANIARWNGQSWSTLGSGVNATVRCMAPFDDGTGSALYVGGDFTEAGGATATHIARWNGSTWSALGSGLDGTPHAMGIYEAAGERSLVVGGWFPSPEAYLARWVGCDTCYPDCNGSGGLTIADFGCFQAKFAGGDPYADCNSSGTLTIADFGCFQSKFASGCP